MSVYVGLLQRVLSESAPSFLRNRYGRAFLESIGLTLDVATETLHRGLDQSNPLVCEESSLSVIGADRGIRRYPTEPVASYRLRLARWRQIKKHAGSHYGEMISLQPYFYPFVPRLRVFHQAGDGSCSTCHTLDPGGTYSVHKSTPSNFDYDGATAKWSRAFLVIDGSTMTRDPAHYDDGTTYDDGTVWDGYLSSAARDDIVSIFNDSKAAHSALWAVIICDNAADFDPTLTATTDADGRTSLPVGNWGSAIDAGTGHPSRLISAHFIYDLGQG